MESLLVPFRTSLWVGFIPPMGYSSHEQISGIEKETLSGNGKGHQLTSVSDYLGKGKGEGKIKSFDTKALGTMYLSVRAQEPLLGD